MIVYLQDDTKCLGCDKDIVVEGKQVTCEHCGTSLPVAPLHDTEPNEILKKSYDKYKNSEKNTRKYLMVALGIIGITLQMGVFTLIIRALMRYLDMI